MASDRCTFYTYRTTFGPLTIGSDGEGVSAVVFGDVQLAGTFTPADVTNRAATEVMEYLAGKRAAFTVPLSLGGTAFQHDVWRAVANIPYGHTRTARELAATLGSPQSYRRVGSALKACPTPLLVPTHRVVGADGRPLGTGEAAERAHAFLQLEAGQ